MSPPDTTPGASPCDPLIDDLFTFPQKPGNRPGLPRIACRIGAYPDLVEAMLRQVDNEVALAAWTHRSPDDPAIALLESAALVGDVLTFYQERYANEAFLRSATWRESVAGLVRLTGYRLAPGLGAKLRLALTLKPAAKALTIPAGYAFRADLAPEPGAGATSADFCTDAALEAYPHLSAFHLYHPRSYAAGLHTGQTQVELLQVAGDSQIAALLSPGLKKGDRLVLMPQAPPWVTNAAAQFTAPDKREVVTLKSVRQIHDRLVLELEEPIRRTWSGPVRAFRLGRVWRHFGHNAPPRYTVPAVTGSAVVGTNSMSTSYLRHIYDLTLCEHSSMKDGLPGRIMPLDQEVADLQPGAWLAIFVTVSMVTGSGLLRYDCTFRREATAVRQTSRSFGPLTASLTELTLDAALLSNNSVDLDADIRDIRVHEITSPELMLRSPAQVSTTTTASGNQVLCFFGTRDEARKLAGRALILVHEDGRSTEATCLSEDTDFPPEGGSSQAALRRMWPITLDRAPAPFSGLSFPEEAPRITVYGNTVIASQGKWLPPTVLGNGDARAAFQTFALPKPVTHLLRPEADPPQVPELTVRVNGREVPRVASLYAQPGDRLVYVLLTDEAGAHYIQFGDGETGARLPSGQGNVSCEMRTGTGARGRLAEGASPNAALRIEGVSDLFLHGEVTGGADPETADNARLAAPGRVQGLGRIVSLADYESELRQIPGIARVRAAWDIRDGVPSVVAQILPESGREAEYAAIAATAQSFQRLRGPNRFPLLVERASLRQVALDLSFAHDPALSREAVLARVRAKLAPMDLAQGGAEGIFALASRQIGGAEFASRIEGLIQALPGIFIARVEGFVLLGATPSGQSPASVAQPPAPRARAAKISPAASELLQLHSAHLTLIATAATVTEGLT